jgi:acyl-[acyl-carrier-protein]-phospholipid O-acyltransferase / long-chain-fatty-acid--[acyl-carrier-protein] ligase
MLFAYIAGSDTFEWPDLAALGGLVVAYLVMVYLWPSVALRPVFWLITKTVYRIRPHGVENIPKEGPAFLLCNHVTYIDWLLIWAVSPRKVRFVAWAGWSKNPLFRWFLRVTNSILIDGTGGPKALLRTLKEVAADLDRGGVVCLFPEGALSRGGGSMLPFRRGFERILKETKVPVPVIPVCLNQVWGSVFSYAKGSVIFKWPERLPFRVAVAVGKPMPQPVSVLGVRLAIQELAAETAIRQSDYLLPVHRQFVRVACRFSNLFRTCWIDASTGTSRELSYLKSLVGCLCMRGWLKPRIGTEQNVGLWLPTSLGGALANVALTMLGRTTVNLNYTAGASATQSAIKQTGMKTIITSKKFLARMPLQAEGVQIIHLEDALTGISKWQRIRNLLCVLLLPGWVVDRVILRLGSCKLDDIVTIIFSSGSTGDPKGVMLSHRNLASNTSEAIVHLMLYKWDRFLGALPFFHSFGYAILLWLPTQFGGSIVFYPDPRQAKEIGELCRKHGCTGLLGTATFLRFYLRRCEPEDFQTVRQIICGAEKLPPALAMEFREKFGVLPMEGYGCTELSPVISVNVLDVDVAGIRQIRNKTGTVGHPLSGVAARIVDPDTFEVLPPGSEGMILIKGANVMAGYLNKPEMTAKVIRDGWYVTGDMAKIDDDGFITITGRLSRFAKIGGEMVPLEKVEEELHACLGTNDRVVAVTSVQDERKGERLIVLHLASLAIPPKDLGKKLSEAGLPNLWIPGERDYYVVDEMPALGSGKLDLRRIKEIATAITSQS